MNLEGLDRTIADVTASSEEILQRQMYGGFSDRNPALGKMIKCRKCGARRREFSAEKCCTGEIKIEVPNDSVVRRIKLNFLRKTHKKQKSRAERREEKRKG